MDKNKFWNNLKCPLCGENDFEVTQGFELTSLDNLDKNLKIEKEEDKLFTEYMVDIYKCKTCDNILLRKHNIAD